MANRPKPPTVSNDEIDRVEALLEGVETDVKFRQNLGGWNYLLDKQRISAFAYFAEIISYIVRAHVNDPEWVTYLSKRNLKDESEPMVTIPISFLGPLAAGWMDYREADYNLSLGRACGVEAGGKASGQGKRNDRDMFNKYELDYYLALNVVASRAFAAQGGEAISLPTAFRRVAEHYKDFKGPARVGRSRIETAYNEHGQRVLETLKWIGLPMTPVNFEKSSGS